MKFRLRKPWKRRPSERPGEESWRLRPDPALRTVTVEVAERGLEMMGVTLEELLSGEARAEPRLPADAEAFFEAVLENASSYDLKGWPLPLARAALEQVAAAFFLECVRSSRPQTSAA